MNEETRILAAINSLRESLNGYPALKIDVANLKDDVKELKASDTVQNRYLWITTGALLALGFLAKYGPAILNALGMR